MAKHKYISQDAAIDAVDVCNLHRGIIDALQAIISDIPSADVRPVVLCRDCKHFNPYPGDCTDGVIEGVCKRHNSIGVLVTDEDFCSDAERI